MKHIFSKQLSKKHSLAVMKEDTILSSNDVEVSNYRFILVEEDDNGNHKSTYCQGIARIRWSEMTNTAWVSGEIFEEIFKDKLVDDQLVTEHDNANSWYLLGDRKIMRKHFTELVANFVGTGIVPKMKHIIVCKRKLANEFGYCLDKRLDTVL